MVKNKLIKYYGKTKFFGKEQDAQYIALRKGKSLLLEMSFSGIIAS